MRTVEQACVAAQGVDAVTLINADAARALKNKGISYALQYLGTVTPTSLNGLLSAGLAFMPVTYANAFSGTQTVAECKALEVSPGTTVWLDLESVRGLGPASVCSAVNAWADAVQTAGYMPGLYAGSGSLLTNDELYSLHVVRYWKSLSKVIDRHGVYAEPDCGWCMYQLFPSLSLAGVWVDIDVVQEDYKHRLPFWTVNR